MSNECLKTLCAYRVCLWNEQTKFITARSAIFLYHTADAAYYFVLCAQIIHTKYM